MIKITKMEKKAKAQAKKLAFKATHEVHDRFKTLVKEAKAAGFKVDFDSDFVKWLNRQLTHLEKHLRADDHKPHGKGK